jgi:hypothetical protein
VDIANVKTDLTKLETVNELQHNLIWQGINRMVGWVVAGMGAVIIGVVTMLGTYFLGKH